MARIPPTAHTSDPADLAHTFLDRRKAAIDVLSEAAVTCAAYHGAKGMAFEEVPIAQKRDIRDKCDKYLSRHVNGVERAALLRQIEHLTDRCVSTVPYQVYWRDLYLERSSGTVGPPTWFARTRHERLQLAACVHRERKRFSASFRLATFYNTEYTIPPSEGDARAWLQRHYDDIHSRLKNREIEYLYGRRSVIDRLANEMDRRGFASGRLSVEVGGEFIDENNTSGIRSTFGENLIKQYACRECWAMGYAQGGGTGYSVCPGVYIELIDDDGQVVTEADHVGAIVVTSLVCRLLPIIRYATGDRGRWIDSTGRRLLWVEDERIACRFLRANGQAVSGAQLVRGIVAGALRRSGRCPIYPFKVRKRGRVVYWYLCPRDIACENALAEEIADGCWFVGLDVRFLKWRGWAPGEKQLLFVDESRSDA